ncbi:hypothetical protein O6H91_07G004900 [Diphasiastrum complanatum]|uniref:Uncharacterized protein n=1 Tax=Diphasiastrum complanatum TaxID=34168 RepID=A0ACC2D255_DIPCM|nr:hypothetical protein O6H91_07G004900 [Diphasiastrum complanatum]
MALIASSPIGTAHYSIRILALSHRPWSGTFVKSKVWKSNKKKGVWSQQQGGGGRGALAVLVQEPPQRFDSDGKWQPQIDGENGGSENGSATSIVTRDDGKRVYLVKTGAVLGKDDLKVASILTKQIENRRKQAAIDDEARAEAQAALRAANAPVYDPRSLSERYRRQPLKVLRRMLQVAVELGSFAASIYLDQKRGQLQANMWKRAVELREKLTRLGPTFVKVGQGLSTRPDLCPPEYLEELTKLQDSLPTFPDIEAFSCIENELGATLESIYSEISPSPIAAASLGQVYKARLQSGEVVAVKVQRPDIEEAIALDFYLLRELSQLVDNYVEIVSSNVVALLDEFATRVYQELNYVQEAHNAVKFKQLYGDRPDVIVPGVFWNCTSSKVLTMVWIDGIKLSEQEAIEKRGLNILQLVDTGIQCSLRQLLEHGYFHADPHPGNLLATSDGKLAFVDFGMMSETPEQARFAIIGHVVHLVNRDYEAMAQDYYALDFLSSEVDVSPIVPVLKGFFDDVLNATVSELNFKTIVDGLGAVLYQFPFDVPPYYALILRSLTVLEGLALYTDPNFKVLAAAYPYFAKRLLTDSNPYLRDALIELLFKDGSFRWNRLENLLIQGRKSSDFVANDALQPVVKLLLGPEGAELRILVEKEAIRVMEALILGTAVEGYRAIPEPLKALVGGGSNASPIRMKESEQSAMLVLRAQILRIWSLLQNSKGFDPAMLEPIVEVLRQPEAQAIGGRVAGGLTQRLAARLLQQLLRPASTPAKFN